jgi:hypothetical protein
MKNLQWAFYTDKNPKGYEINNNKNPIVDLYGLLTEKQNNIEVIVSYYLINDIIFENKNVIEMYLGSSFLELIHDFIPSFKGSIRFRLDPKLNANEIIIKNGPYEEIYAFIDRK